MVADEQEEMYNSSIDCVSNEETASIFCDVVSVAQHVTWPTSTVDVHNLRVRCSEGVPSVELRILVNDLSADQDEVSADVFVFALNALRCWT